MDMTATKTQTAGHLLAETFIRAGASRAWCVPGESYLGLLDGLRDRPEFRVITCRHEGGAGFMALADARMSGLPGLVMISRGPGIGNVMIAAHVAQQDGVPLILLVGQVPRDVRGRQAFQEVDYSRTFSDIAKAVFEVTDASRVGEFAAQAWHVSLAGRPGSVVLTLPEDMLLEQVTSPVPTLVEPARPRPSDLDIKHLEALMLDARKPLLVAGEALASDDGRDALIDCAEKWNLPVICGHKHQDLFPNRHPNWAGHIGHVIPPEQARAWADADLIIAAGSILGDIDSQGYTFPVFPEPHQKLIQIHHDPVALGRHYRPTVAVCADAAETLQVLAKSSVGDLPDAWPERLHALAIPAASPAFEGRATYAQVLGAVDQKAASDAIFTMDSGRFASLAHRLIAYGSGRRLIGTASGAMGNGVPAAVAAAVMYPQRQVIAIVGDGGLLMTGNELATAIRQGVAIRILVANNNGYGAIAGHQEKLFPGRSHSMALSNPDFSAWIAAFGGLGLRASESGGVDAIVERFLTHPGPTLLEVASE